MGVVRTNFRHTELFMDHICDQVGTHCTAARLSFIGCEIGDAELHQIATATAKSAKQSSLTWLHLGSNQITDQGARHIATIIRSTKHSLLCLNLWANHISNEGTHHILSTILSEVCVLEELSLARNDIGDEGARHIATAILTNRFPLTSLSLWGNSISDIGAKYITQAIHSAETCPLKILDLGKNLIGVQGACCIAMLLESKKSSLISLSVTGNRMPDNISSLLSMALVCSQPMSVIAIEQLEEMRTETLQIQGPVYLQFATCCKWADVAKYVFSRLTCSFREGNGGER
eukprot:c5797_g1_i1.p1 GENE.c5797_g1_i1~~c5797_g1_i1.p1  ORF type:complete len:289 (-),score=43.05 c5797_g1_i1:3-869(-)